MMLSASPLLPPRRNALHRSDNDWTADTENLLIHWVNDWKRRIDAHSESFSYKRALHRWISIPTTVIPLAMTPLTSSKIFDEESSVVTSFMVVTAVLTGLTSYLNYNVEAERHDQAATRYEDLISDAEEIMAKSRDSRSECDLVITHFKTRQECLKRYSPHITLPELGDVTDSV